MWHVVKSLLIFILMLFGLSLQASLAADKVNAEFVSTQNPGTDFWRDIRQRDATVAGISQVKSVDSNILINPQAGEWTRFRVGPLTNYAALMLAGFIAVISLFFVLRGKVKLEGGLSGRMVQRFGDYERILHWALAIIFLFLAITGLALLLGRPVLIPLLGHETFALIASSSKEGHNLFGPIFLLSLFLMVFQFAKRNIYEKGDLNWLLKGGGIVGKSHVSGGFFNMGEKTWYWIVILIGLVISISGLILVSPNFGQGRLVMELAHVVHVITAIFLIALSFGHMYLGWIGTEGTMEGMKTGYVDINWAGAHHDRWAQECSEKDLVISQEEYFRLQGSNANEPTEGLKNG